MNSQQIIRSYVLRQGRITEAQKRFLHTHAPFYVATKPEGLSVSLQSSPLYIEIGFGYGEATAIIAQSNPNNHYLAFEVHTPGVGALLKKLAEGNINNVRIAHMDAMTTIYHHVPSASVSGFHIFFPDPWRKARHHKRRLIRDDFVETMAEKLIDGGCIVCVTDWQNYAEQMQRVFAANKNFIPTAARAQPTTSYKRKALAAGRSIYSFCYKRRERY